MLKNKQLQSMKKKTALNVSNVWFCNTNVMYSGFANIPEIIRFIDRLFEYFFDISIYYTFVQTLFYS